MCANAEKCTQFVIIHFFSIVTKFVVSPRDFCNLGLTAVPIIAAAYSSSSKKKPSRPYHTPLDIPMETSLTTRSPIFPTTDISA